MRMLHIVSIGASTSLHSINQKLANYTASLFDNATAHALNLNDYEMPLFSIDRELRNGAPPPAFYFLRKMSEADVIVLSLAEHNGSYSAAFKNILDWVSRIDRKVFQDKPMILLSTSEGARGGKTVMDLAVRTLPFLGANIIAHLSIPTFSSNYDHTVEVITSTAINSQLQSMVHSVESLFCRDKAKINL